MFVIYNYLILYTGNDNAIEVQFFGLTKLIKGLITFVSPQNKIVVLLLLQFTDHFMFVVIACFLWHSRWFSDNRLIYEFIYL